MQCSDCQASMELIKQEVTDYSLVQWHRCPVCERAHLSSEPMLLVDELPGLKGQNLEFRSARTRTHGSAYSGPERRQPRRNRSTLAF